MTLTDEPQPILLEPISHQVTNRTALISWVFPGGQVDEYLIQYKERLNDWTSDNDVIERRIPSHVTMVILTDLIPSALYDVRVASVNAMGTSQFLFQVEFSTQRKFCNLVHCSVVQDNQCVRGKFWSGSYF